MSLECTTSRFVFEYCCYVSSNNSSNDSIDYPLNFNGDIIRVANTVLIEGRRGGVTTGQALLNDDYQDLLHYNISCHFNFQKEELTEVMVVVTIVAYDAYVYLKSCALARDSGQCNPLLSNLHCYFDECFQLQNNLLNVIVNLSLIVYEHVNIHMLVE
ncbi:hypothetical protein RIR_jg27689.t1 [Rhizophagus irregularis DAOM 181602=DAOM 197198]|nr:hypothetical protein RIR_jg27689.t1 [Rhizophagus irregularis DAOM 181602=DAOM 197198]